MRASRAGRLDEWAAVGDRFAPAADVPAHRRHPKRAARDGFDGLGIASAIYDIVGFPPLKYAAEPAIGPVISFASERGSVELFQLRSKSTMARFVIVASTM
jgi:hypothetical protein